VPFTPVGQNFSLFVEILTCNFYKLCFN